MRARFIIQGRTGLGKTTLTKLLHKYAKTKDGEQPREPRGADSSDSSESNTTKILVLQSNHYEMEDHPGMRDTDGKDDEYFKLLIHSIKAKGVNVLLFVTAASENNRIDMDIKQRICQVVECLQTPELIDKCILVTTKFADKFKHSAERTMIDTLRSVYEHFHQAVPNHEELHKRVFCLDCDPNDTKAKRNGSISTLELGLMHTNLIDECMKILALGDNCDKVMKKRTLSHVDESASIKAHMSKKRTQPKISEVLFQHPSPSSHPVTPVTPPPIRAPLQISPQKIPTRKSNSNDSYVEIFLQQHGLQASPRHFVGSQWLRRTWCNFAKQRKITTKFDDILKVLAQKCNTSVKMAKFQQWCKDCKTLRSSPKIRQSYPGLDEFCTCNQILAKKTLIMGLHSEIYSFD